MIELSREQPVYGCPKILKLLRDEGFRVGKERGRRLWVDSGLKLPRKTRRCRHKGVSMNACHIRRALRPNDVWAYDFVQEITCYGKKIRILAIVDEFTRECLALIADWSIGGAKVVRALNSLVTLRGAPRCIRSDNGPEFVSKAVCKWLKYRNIETLFIAPGSPWENGYIESFNSRLRNEFLNRWLFSSLREMKVYLAAHMSWYNEKRIHAGINYMTPRDFAQKFASMAMAS